jgi:hypothetical protein
MMMKRQKARLRFSPRTRKLLLIGSLSLVALFIVVNAVLWGIYRNRTYPGTRVMETTIGSVAYSGLAAKVSSEKLLPDTLTFTHSTHTVKISLNELGITKDVGRTIRSANKQRSWLPIANVFSKPVLQAPVSIDNAALKNRIEKLSKTFRVDAVNARLNVNGTTVQIVNANNGFELDKTAVQSKVLPLLDKGEVTVRAPVTITKPQVTADSLKTAKTDLENQFKVTVAYTYNGKRKQATAAEVAGWYVPANTTYVPDTTKIQNYITATGNSFGIRVKDAAGGATTTAQNLAKKQATELTLVAQPAALKTFSYCVAAKGVDASYLPGLRAKLKETYADSRGWSVGGLVEYKEVSSGCSFTVWLSAANLMPTFGAICDSMWSCRVGPNVVINFDRWQNASPAWNQLGGTLSDYRHMVINHETGHWLGFGHSYCPGPGQAAPVMQQQSIDLQGCTFNPWPTAGETATLRRNLGI